MLSRLCPTPQEYDKKSFDKKLGPEKGAGKKFLNSPEKVLIRKIFTYLFQFDFVLEFKKLELDPRFGGVTKKLVDPSQTRKVSCNKPGVYT